MIGLVLAILFGGALLGTLHLAGQLRRGSTFWLIIMGGYVLRLFIQAYIRDVRLFSHDIGGDALIYEEYGAVIARIWNHTGVHFITANEFPDIGPTSLPQNLFALVIYLNDGAFTRLGCTALVALAAGLTVINVHSLALQFGATARSALVIASLLYFDPTFLYYTSDMYKDGLVLCFTMGALGSALRLSWRLSLVHAVIGAACIWALWYVRFYLIFVTVAPLVVGIVGIGTKNVTRPVIAALLLLATLIALVSSTDILQLASERANQTFLHGTSSQVLSANASGGSGVTFDDGGSPYGALPAKLAYTLFSPFLWASGSLGFHIGKIDALLWYFILYRAIRAARTADRRLVLMLMTFLLPCTLMYAMSMSNVGLIVRQRLVIVAAAAILASLYARQSDVKEIRVGVPQVS